MKDDDDGRLERARKQVRLIEARGEFAEARSERLLRSCADDAAEIRLGGTDQALLDRHAFRTRTALDAERFVQADRCGEVVLCDVFEVYATRAMIASHTIYELRSSVPCVLVGGDVCRWVLAVAAELLHAVGAAADPEVGCRVRIAIDNVAGVGLVMRLASLGGASRPVSAHSGVGAVERAGRVMRMLGDFRQAVEGKDIVYMATFAGSFECVPF